MKNLLKIFGFFLCFLMLFSKGDGMAGDQKLVWVSYGGGRYGQSQRLAFFEPFSLNTGVKVIETAWGAEYSKLKAMVKSGKVKWDIVEINNSGMKIGVKDGLFEKIDYDKIKVSKNDCFAGTLTTYGIGSIYWPTMLMWNTQVFPGGNHPKNWADFWNVKKFPGDRSLQDTPGGNLEFALLADGVPEDKLYPLDVDRAFKKLDEIKPHIYVWWSKGAQPPELVGSKEVVMSSVWVGRWWNAMREGITVNGTFNEGAMEIDYWVIPKGAPNKEAVYKFFNWYFSNPDNHAWHALDFNVGFIVKNAAKYMNKEQLSHLPSSPENFAKQFQLNSDWWAKNLEKMNERWQEWKLE